MIRKETIQEYLDKGYSFRKISRSLNVTPDTVFYWANKYGLSSRYEKLPSIKIDKINTREEAYMLGFLLGDSHIDNRGVMTCNIAIRDREILEFISNIIGTRIIDSKKLNKKKRQFPRSTISRKIDGLEKLFGGRMKEERRVPRIKKNLEKYLLLGFFDAEGSVSFGFRKDRDRL